MDIIPGTDDPGLPRSGLADALLRGLARQGDGVRILVHAPDAAPAEAVIARAMPAAQIVGHAGYDGLAERLAQLRPHACLSYRAGAGYPRDALMEGPHAPAYTHVAGTGFDHLLPFDPERVTVCNSAGFQAAAMADYALAGIYAINLDFAAFHRQQAARHWAGRMLRVAEGQHAVVLGTGPIGAAIARRLTAAGLRVTGVSRSGRAHPDFATVHPATALGEAVRGADHLVVVIPLTAESRGMVSAAVLDALSPGAGVVNLARGGIVDEDAVLARLRSGHLRGAVFDVFATEPLARDSPLWDAPGMTVTPHSCALFDGWEAAAAEVFAENLRRLGRGEPPRNRVDPGRGY